MSYSPSELEAIYAKRQEAIATLSDRNVITVADLRNLDRLGRCRVANELWAQCDQGARDALLRDEHAHVRSCATLAR